MNLQPKNFELETTTVWSFIDLDNIESTFGAFEMGRLINRLGDYSIGDINELNKSVRRLILRTLELLIKLYKSDEHYIPPKPYGDFANLVQNIRESGQTPACSTLTFNYDVAIDYAFHFYGLPVDYCLSESSTQRFFKLLKLHGSLNWGRCIKCNSIIPWYFKDFFSKFHFANWPDTKFAYLDIGSKLVNHKHCETQLSDEPILVPPTWNKTEYHTTLSHVWSQAAKELSEAENIFVIGYSLPESDLFFRYLFALGTVGIAHINRFWVFNPDPTGEVQERFEGLIGTGIKRRFNFEKKTFTEAIPIIENELNIKEEH